MNAFTKTLYIDIAHVLCLWRQKLTTTVNTVDKKTNKAVGFWLNEYDFFLISTIDSTLNYWWDGERKACVLAKKASFSRKCSANICIIGTHTRCTIQSDKMSCKSENTCTSFDAENYSRRFGNICQWPLHSHANDCCFFFLVRFFWIWNIAEISVETILIRHTMNSPITINFTFQRMIMNI